MNKTIQLSSLLTLIFALAQTTLFVSFVHANTYTVVSTANSGVGTLRWAITQANARIGPDTINFNIVGFGNGAYTISPTSVLPAISDDETMINGFSQPGAAMASISTPIPVLKIEVEGSSAGSVNGLRIKSANNTIRGLIINRFAGNGIYMYTSDATDNHIAGNMIGTDATGNIDLGNGLDGVFIGSGASYNTIG